jgi:hypothetical protein
MQNGKVTLKDILAVSYKRKYTLYHLIHQSYSLEFTEGVENLDAHKNLHMDIFRSFTHDCQILELITMSFSKRIVSKLVNSDSGILFHAKRK